MTEDPLLPAAPYLSGAHIADVLGAAVAAGGGELLQVRPRDVHYRPGRDLIAGFDALVRWGSDEPRSELLLAGTTVDGVPPGTMPVEAGDLQVGVWRFPFDPVLVGLDHAARRGGAAELLGFPVGPLHVVSYRPCRRAVVQVEVPGTPGGVYIKVLPPAEAADVIARHGVLGAAGIPVPEVQGADEPRGLVVLRALAGDDVRQRLLDGTGPAPSAAALVDLVASLAAIDSRALPARPLPLGLVAVAPRHAAMLAAVAPSLAPSLEALSTRLAAGAAVASRPVTVHGDLHEAQLRVDAGGRIVGVLDVDDAGPGDPLDDLARAAAHLEALWRAAPSRRLDIARHARTVRRELRATVDDEVGLSTRLAAALVGLATGPFRARRPGWRAQAAGLIAVADRILDGRSR